jgi:hypothetical protein
VQQKEIKNCQNCKQSFVIEPEDFEFYKKIKVLPPTWCPDCRMVRRMMWRNERTLYKRKCDAPEHSEEVISIYQKDSFVRVYDQKYWWSDAWDPASYGKNYDFNKPFLEQFKELLQGVPQGNLVAENNINSDFSNFMTNSKDCYLISGGNSNESILYANHGEHSSDSVDLYYFTKVALSYESVLCQNSYKLLFSQNCDNCSDSYFLYNCNNCQNCFGCVNLKNKQYHIFNKPYSKEEYKKKLEEFDLGGMHNVLQQRELFERFKLQYPRKFINVLRASEVSGDNIFDAKNCKLAFDVLPGGSENGKFVFWSGANMKDVYDGTGIGVDSELLYEGVSVALFNSKVYFSVITRNSTDIRYSFNCHSSSNLFGCIGLKKKQYCILNKQYTKEEYEALVPRIIQHMNDMPYIDKKGRVYTYGEFFPPELSPFSYNETIAQEYFPLSREQAQEQGYTWKDPDTKEYSISIQSKDLPDHIKDVKDDILEQTIGCASKDNSDALWGRSPDPVTSGCSTAFRIIPQELEFYRKMNVPLPRLCPNCRHYQRLRQRNPLKLWHRKCQCLSAEASAKEDSYKNTTSHSHGQSPCPNEFETSYAPERPEIVYCEGCYQNEVV